jgi:hypothetical protein
MGSIKTFMIGIDLLGLLFSVIALLNRYKDKDMRYFNPIISDMYSTLEWNILIFIGLLMCIFFMG